jgi:RND family efflux transporter MFP subunit
MKPKFLAPIVVIAAGLVLSLVLIGTSETLVPAQPQPVPTAVHVIRAQPDAIQLKVYAQGNVVPRTESNIVPEVSGNVTWISPNLVSGGYLRAGEALLRIDDRDYRDSVQRAEAALQRAQAENELAQFEFERADELHSKDLISRNDLEAKRRSARVSEAALKDASFALKSARRDLVRTEIVAPFDGLIRSEQVDVGQFISRGAQVASVYATDYVEVRLPIADSQLAYLNLPLNQRGELPESVAPNVNLSSSFAGREQEWTGKLVRTEAQIDPGSRMVYAIARVRGDDSSGTLPPPVGLFVQAEIEGNAEDNIVVLPRTALRNGNRLLVVDAENRLHFRDVEVLRVFRDKVYVSAGLEAGELVVTSLLQTVVEGMPVQPLLREG